ncbi:flagella basal body P-ring formation protein FlgA [Novosphingobium rosa]|uniref:flagella basal body P-ring formation protein FlgA n=1 Tax=Novosphingobium rosa TaxID=76978 RepID=UPI00082B892D|nr:flagella basal body P-ring formation protein FlgA [Novosphingobium rosa]
MRLSKLLMAALPLLAATPAMAQGAYTDPAAIDREVSAFTGVPIGGTGGATLPVDRRLRLAACRSPLGLSWRTSRHDSLVVECPDPGSWHLFVPVRAAAAAAAVPSTPAIMRGEAVTIAVAGDGFAVTQPGEALDAGAVGEWIRVRSLRVGNRQPGQQAAEAIRARIVRPGEVEVPIEE